jgi:hypothetical protein
LVNVTPKYRLKFSVGDFVFIHRFSGSEMINSWLIAHDLKTFFLKKKKVGKSPIALNNSIIVLGN